MRGQGLLPVGLPVPGEKLVQTGLRQVGDAVEDTQVQTTARYAHLARDSIQTAAARITGSIGGNLSSVRGPDKTTAH